jgi:hypothetical protein
MVSSCRTVSAWLPSGRFKVATMSTSASNWEEALAGREAALWLHAGSLTLEHEGRALSRYDVERAAGTDRLASVARPRLFQTPYALVQPRLFRLDEAVWLKALKLDDYAARKLRRPSALQGVLFSYLDAL